MLKLVAFASVAALVASVGVAQQKDARSTRGRTVTVHGKGSVVTAPDQVRLSVQVNTRGESANAAMSSASGKTKEILLLLKNLGVDAKDVQTSRVSVAPILDYQRNIQPPPIIGYSGTNDFSILFKGKFMDKVGEFMDKAVAAGATSFGGLQYETSRQRELERDALLSAAQDARARATVLAKELNADLGEVVGITESGAGPAPVARGIMMSETAVAGAPVMTGELTISVQVTVVFELK